MPSQEIAYEERVMKKRGDDVRHEEENEEAGVGKNSEMISSMKKRMYKENEEAEYESIDSVVDGFRETKNKTREKI